jgi:hypothetical protein
LRRKARGRPQIWQRLCWREENFGFFASFTRFAVVAMYSFLLLLSPDNPAQTFVSGGAAL